MATINYLTTVQFDFGAIRSLSAELKSHNIRKPLVVTDAGIRKVGLLDGILSELQSVAIFDKTPPNPTEEAVIEATYLYLNDQCDGIVAIGGGSSIDLGKAVALLATHGGPLQQYAAAEGGVVKITNRIAPLIAVPTTAGTGSEVGRAAVIVMNSGRKLGLLSPYLLPRLAICDPELTYKLPAELTAATGMDAIAHCIETFLAPSVNPPAEAIALDGLSRAVNNIEKAVKDGSQPQARWNMMMAAMEGALAFQKGLGAVHALSHPLGALKEVSLHHGTLNAILLPAVIRFNKLFVGDKMSKIAVALGIAPDDDCASFIVGLNERLGLPGGLNDMGVDPAVFPAIAEQALEDHCHATNPRVASKQDYLELLEASRNNGARH